MLRGFTPSFAASPAWMGQSELTGAAGAGAGPAVRLLPILSLAPKII